MASTSTSPGSREPITLWVVVQRDGNKSKSRSADLSPSPVNARASPAVRSSSLFAPMGGRFLAPRSSHWLIAEQVSRGVCTMATSAIGLTVVRVLCREPADVRVGTVTSVAGQLGRISCSTGHATSTASGPRRSTFDGLVPLELCVRSGEGQELPKPIAEAKFVSPRLERRGSIDMSKCGLPLDRGRSTGAAASLGHQSTEEGRVS